MDIATLTVEGNALVRQEGPYFTCQEIWLYLRAPSPPAVPRTQSYIQEGHAIVESDTRHDNLYVGSPPIFPPFFPLSLYSGSPIKERLPAAIRDSLILAREDPHTFPSFNQYSETQRQKENKKYSVKH